MRNADGGNADFHINPYPACIRFSDDEGQQSGLETENVDVIETRMSLITTSGPLDTHQLETAITRTVQTGYNSGSDAESVAEPTGGEIEGVALTQQYPSTPTSPNRIGRGGTLTHATNQQEIAESPTPLRRLGQPYYRDSAQGRTIQVGSAQRINRKSAETRAIRPHRYGPDRSDGQAINPMHHPPGIGQQASERSTDVIPHVYGYNVFTNIHYMP